MKIRDGEKREVRECAITPNALRAVSVVGALALLRSHCFPSNPHFLSYCAGKTDPVLPDCLVTSAEAVGGNLPVAGVRNANVLQRRLVFASPWLYSGIAVYPSVVLLTE